jgi:hypothetical protein
MVKEHRALASFNEDTGRIHIELEEPFDHRVFRRVIEGSTQPPKPAAMDFDVVERDGEVWGIEFDI